MTKTKKTKKKPETKPLRVNGAKAAALLSVGRDRFNDISHEGILTVIGDPRGRGRGRRTYYMVDEIELYAVTNDPEKVRAFRREKGRLKP